MPIAMQSILVFIRVGTNGVNPELASQFQQLAFSPLATERLTLFSGLSTVSLASEVKRLVLTQLRRRNCVRFSYFCLA
ncbi:hypothetical protein CPB84DRAFT_1771507 [Gymnopilus junonius]|uniref:Uncharacterized protein n=1 Tax=Gymnopilus junonius TaxID=109634 RepID=A0A9P5TPS5_GYMJU|nr:hypothetical protein CPB84DRAFT_1771507 [Gymnopilus junonius]